MRLNQVFILLLTIMIVVFSAINICLYKPFEKFESNHKIVALTFGGGGQNYYDAVNRIKNEFYQTNVFDEIIAYTDSDLKKYPEFLEKHSEFIQNNKRGYGYWVWKPYLIMKTLEMMNENDILFYLDVGCEIIDYSKNAIHLLKGIIDKCEKYNILYTETGHNEKSHTKMDVFNYMGLIYNNQIMDSMQYQTGVIIIKKTVINTSFVKDWYNIICNYNLVNDSKSVLPNHSSFIENRHDQSIFSLLLKTDKYNHMNTENNILKKPYPILTSRKRHG